VTRKYLLDDISLDLGDIGSQPVSAVGVITCEDDSAECYSTQITSVIAHLTLLNGAMMNLDVTHMITRGAMVSLREALEQKFEADVA